MCSILGGTIFDGRALAIYDLAKNRGRDFSGMVQMGEQWIANHRATPTNESASGVENQPFGKTFKVVHNGTIANDRELGNPDGAIDSQILAEILDPSCAFNMADSLTKIRGSYAIATLSPDGIMLACNYKPIWIKQTPDGHIFFSSLREHLEPIIGEPSRMLPYSVHDLRTGTKLTLPRHQPDRALIICSGGLDSTAITGYAKQNHDEIRLLHFDYGCKAGEKEKEAIKLIATALECSADIIPIDYGKFSGGSTLFNSEDIKTGKDGVEYALDWVPARNLVLLSMATAYAEANGFGHIYLGSNLEEAGAYPDNEEQFIRDFDNLLYGAVQNGYKVELHTPLGGLMKREIVDFGVSHGSPLEFSWSCYNGGKHHCGECAPCYMRKEAYIRAGVEDPTRYANSN